ncbi:MAG: hypothetical protein IPO41_16560 [Acidobacteria bacterium]|nr:hypothetical protein [Acidobacteriota bacterium]
MNWLYEFWESLTFGRVALGVGLFLGSLLLSFAAIGIVMVKIPANYLARITSRIFCQIAIGRFAGEP